MLIMYFGEYRKGGSKFCNMDFFKQGLKTWLKKRASESSQVPGTVIYAWIWFKHTTPKRLKQVLEGY